MAKYGGSRYGTGFKYGETTAVSVYYNSNIRAWSYNYGTVRLFWDPIVSNPTDDAPTHWKLVKSYTGLLDNPNDGITLAGGLYSTFLTSYTDIEYVNAGVEANYSIWVFNGSKWFFCGADYAVIVPDRNSIAQFTNWLPKAWLNPVDQVGEALGSNNDNTLVTTLGVYAFVYDMLRTEAALLGQVNNHSYTPTSVLKNKVLDLGFNYEPALGDTYHRSLFGAGNIINSYKGVNLGVTTYTTALTHWGSSVEVGHNTLLDYNDSSFEESVGRWKASGGTLIAAKYLGAPIGSPLTKVLHDTLYPPKTVGYGQFTTTGVTARTLTLPDPALDVTVYGAPVKERTRYLFSGWVTDLNNPADVKVKINWYNRFGVLITATAYGPTVTTTDAWQEFVSPSDSGRNGKLSPVGATYASIIISVTPSISATNVYAFDFFQLAEASKSFEYEDARRIRIYVKGDKQNYMANTDFEDGTDTWTSVNGSLTMHAGNPAASIYGDHAAQLMSSSNGTTAFVGDWLAVEPSKVVTFSAYITGPAGRTAKARLEFSSQASSDRQTAVLSDTDGEYYPTEVYYVDSAPMTLTTTPQQISVTAIVPPYSRDSGMPLAKPSVYITDNVSGDIYWMDGDMLEEKPYSSPYFSGDGGVFPSNPATTVYYDPDDTKWEYKNMYNYVSNPSFEVDTTDWSSTGTLTRVTTDGSYGPLFGTRFGKITFTTSTSVTFTSYLPTAAIGGEDVIASVYVRNAVGTYTMNNTAFYVDANDQYNWTRIYEVKQLTAGQTSVSFTVNLSGTSATAFHIDAAQVEYGRIASKFVDPSVAATVAIANPLTSGKTIYATQGESNSGGTSSYFYNYKTKIARLNNTLPLVMPTGSNWCVKLGPSVDGFTDLSESLIPSSSFEVDLGSWTGTNSTLTRVISRGTLLNENTSHGQAYCKVTRSSGTSFSIKTDKVYLAPTGGYYASVALRPDSADAYGDYKLTVDFYDANNNVIVVYLDNLTNRYTTSSLDSSGAPNSVATTAARNKTISINKSDRWAYLANTFPVSSITGAAYAIITVTCTPTTVVSGQAFHIDRAVFRQ